LAAFLGCCILCETSPGQDTNVVAILLRASPYIDGNSYRCSDMVHAVNGLRRLGKGPAIGVLQNYLRENGIEGDLQQRNKILIICRMLFVNPNGWKIPRLGQPDPEVDWTIADKFPLFPIAVSNGVPFLLIRGYNAIGYSGDTPEKCVELCAGFSLVPDDFREGDYENAARELVQSENFQKLYSDSQKRKQWGEMILNQARSPSQN
jgi:hypothetical protein